VTCAEAVSPFGVASIVSGSEIPHSYFGACYLVLALASGSTGGSRETSTSGLAARAVLTMAAMQN